MQDSTTPKCPPRRSKFIRPSPSYRSPLLNKESPKIKSENASTDDIKKLTMDLWQKNEDIKKEIDDLQNQGYKEEQLKWYIDKLHEYNEIKDVAQMVMGRIAEIDQTTVRKVHEEFGMTDED